RKALKKDLYPCRSGTQKCNVTQDGAFTCKRCRFDRFERILKEPSAREPQNDKTHERSSVLPDLPSITPSIIPSLGTGRPLLEKCAISYKMLSAMRRNSELNARPNPPHPAKINAGEYDILACTYGIILGSSRFLITGILDLAEMLFPEFTTFSREEQWKLAVRFYDRFFMFDACYRADKIYPDDMSKALGSYSAYMSVDVAENFFDDCPNQNNIEEAKRILVKFIEMVLPSLRIVIRRANLDESEFLALIILTFWFSDCLQMRDEIVKIGERYRQDVLKELQAHYREDLKLDDYALRIGELFTLIFNFD
ncbi:hypothetical protein PENTCL1PPCAC_14730, partial [Pristionchus entomophagus]